LLLLMESDRQYADGRARQQPGGRGEAACPSVRAELALSELSESKGRRKASLSAA
jgi:hypothetical protein